MLRLALALLFLAPALSAEAATVSAATPFVDAWTFFGRADTGAGMSLAEYDDAIKALGREFDVLCGDTFCDGDFPNLQSLSLDCSVNIYTGKIGECVWTIAGSNTHLDAGSGKLTIRKEVYECNLDIKASAPELAEFLRAAVVPGTTGADGLRGVPLPGSSATLNDVLARCL
jgi:hypothetical protein